MGKKDKLLKKAKNSPQNITFKELCSLARYADFEFSHNSGSHKFYKHPIAKVDRMNFQPDRGDKSKAKSYQVRQLIAAIEDFNLMED